MAGRRKRRWQQTIRVKSRRRRQQERHSLRYVRQEGRCDDDEWGGRVSASYWQGGGWAKSVDEGADCWRLGIGAGMAVF